jgi:NAD(P)-dependent dehydrogenase (short-subunit alcohol dehydrogenase family)
VIVAEKARPPIDGGTVLITGASAGIGRELAVQLAARARTLILLARRAGRLDELRTSLLARHPQLQVLTLPVDLSDETDVDRALAEAGAQAEAIDVLVNNAGVGDQALVDQADWARVRNMLHTNVLAVAQLTTALVPAMVNRGCGVFGQQAFHGRFQRGTARGHDWHRGSGHPGLPRPGGQRVRSGRQVGGWDDRQPAAVRADQRGAVCARGTGGL